MEGTKETWQANAMWDSEFDLEIEKEHWYKKWGTLNSLATSGNFLGLIILLWLYKMLALGDAA